MIEYIILAISVIVPIFGAIGAYVMIKKYTKREFLISMLEEIINEVAENEDLQKKVYMIGALLGQGVKGGIGLGGSGKSGKFRIEDIVGLAMQQFLPKILGNVTPGQTAEAVAESTQVTPYG